MLVVKKLSEIETFEIFFKIHTNLFDLLKRYSTELAI